MGMGKVARETSQGRAGEVFKNSHQQKGKGVRESQTGFSPWGTKHSGPLNIGLWAEWRAAGWGRGDAVLSGLGIPEYLTYLIH